MTKLIYKAGGAIATATLFASMFAGAAFADTTAEISGNGNNSNNTIVTTNVCEATVIQKNKTEVGVNAAVIANTGGNEANNNTGSGVTTDTGNATASATVTVGGSSNSATPPSCCECNGGTTGALISGNGNGSTNDVITTNANGTLAVQKNKTRVGVNALVKAKTGKNKANNNIGGVVDTNTGNAGATLGVSVTPSSNTL
jgi:hypothetical protein